MGLEVSFVIRKHKFSDYIANRAYTPTWLYLYTNMNDDESRSNEDGSQNTKANLIRQENSYNRDNFALILFIFTGNEVYWI